MSDDGYVCVDAWNDDWPEHDFDYGPECLRCGAEEGDDV